jgi:hypothetical protein
MEPSDEDMLTENPTPDNSSDRLLSSPFAKEAVSSMFNQLLKDEDDEMFMIPKFKSSMVETLHSDDYFNRPGPWDDKNLDSILTANRRWGERLRLENSDLLEGFKLGDRKITLHYVFYL